jgi:pyruvate formate lyase activating enzyme
MDPDKLIMEVDKVTQDILDKQIAFTYSEPLVHAEFLLDSMDEAHNKGIAAVLVTNGCINPEAAEEILKRTDAANIDLKCFSQKTYKDILGGNLDNVLDFIRLALNLGVHTEITTLVVPGLNESEGELAEIAGFIAGLSGQEDKTENSTLCWHLSAYHRDWKWNAPPTDQTALANMAKKARKILPYVYTGNIADERNDTLCIKCGAILVQRRNYRIDTGGLCLSRKDSKNQYRCATCGAAAPIR